MQERLGSRVPTPSLSRRYGLARLHLALVGTHPLADEMHRWVAATEEGEVVGHLAAMPQYYRIGG
jgi:hypothetical protein